MLKCNNCKIVHKYMDMHSKFQSKIHIYTGVEKKILKESSVRIENKLLKLMKKITVQNVIT